MVGPGVPVVLYRLMRHRHPSADQPPRSAAEQLFEGRPELPAHGAVKDEVDRRVDERQDVYHVACRGRNRSLISKNRARARARFTANTLFLEIFHRLRNFSMNFFNPSPVSSPPPGNVVL